ncbi:hypothetical protein [Herbidospora cretacea]|uniref:hypothetical protein n=1 Tax=Herbidospora cretacea TaxID=28444 RepID=UPI0012F8E63F|nr:hypothetical protein [Herbidospora cretacea]
MRTGDVWRFRLAETCGHAVCSVLEGVDAQGWRCPVQPSPVQAEQTLVGPGLFVEAPAAMRLSLDTAELARRVAVVCARLSVMPPGKLSALAATGEFADGVTQSAETASVAEAEARALAGQFAEDSAAQTHPQTHLGDTQTGPQVYAAAESQAQQPPVYAPETQAQQPPVYVAEAQETRPRQVRPPQYTIDSQVPVDEGPAQQILTAPMQPQGRDAEPPARPRVRDAEGPGRSQGRGPGRPDRPRGHKRAEPVAEPQAMPQFPMPEIPAGLMVNPGQSPLADLAPGPQQPPPGGPQPGPEIQVPPGQMPIAENAGPPAGPPPPAQGVPAEVPQPVPNAAPAPAPMEPMPESLSGALSNLPPLPQLPPGPPLPPGMVEGGTPPELLMPMATPTPSGPPLTRSLNNTQAIAQEDSGLEIVKGWPGVVAAIAALIAVLALQMRLGRRKVVSDPQPK